MWTDIDLRHGSVAAGGGVVATCSPTAQDVHAFKGFEREGGQAVPGVSLVRGDDTGSARKAVAAGAVSRAMQRLAGLARRHRPMVFTSWMSPFRDLIDKAADVGAVISLRSSVNNASRPRAARSWVEWWLTPAMMLSALLLTQAMAADRESAEAPFLAANTEAMARMMDRMTVRPTGDVDTDFAATMIPHHQGAIDMARAELRWGRNEQLRRIAQEIIVDQQQEISAMRFALGQPLPPSAPAPTRMEPLPSPDVGPRRQITTLSKDPSR